jgi:hypothetical protein
MTTTMKSRIGKGLGIPSRPAATLRSLSFAAILCALMVAGCTPSSGRWAIFLEDFAREAIAAYLL